MNVADNGMKTFFEIKKDVQIIKYISIILDFDAPHMRGEHKMTKV